MIRSYILWLLSALLILGLSTSCNSCGSQNEISSVRDSLEFEDRMLEKTVGECDSLSTAPCVKVSIAFFEALSTPGDSVWMRVNRQLLSDIGGSIQPEDSARSRFADMEGAERTAAMFIDEYEQVCRDMPDFITPWELDITASVHYNQRGYFGYTILTYAYTGGAHGNSASLHRVFDLSTGDSLGFSDLIDLSRLVDFEKVAETAFRAQNQVDSASLNKAGFWFEEDRFYASRNFFLSEKGVHFQYGQYEIAPYSMGQIEFMLEWKEIEPFLGAPFKRIMGSPTAVNVPS